jgi:hypothetical protein
VAIYVENKLLLQQKFKLDNRCTNNQAEQLAISKALEAIETIELAENSPRTTGWTSLYFTYIPTLSLDAAHSDLDYRSDARSV